MKLTRLLTLLMVAVLLFGGLGAAPRAQVPEEKADVPSGPVVARLYVANRDELAPVAGRLDIWEVHYDQGYALIAVRPETYAWLQSLGYRLEIDAERTEQMMNPLGIPSYPCYRTVEETYDTLQQLATDYPGLTELVDIGDSWEKFKPGGLPGYDLWRLRITNEAIPGPKPTFYLMAEIHAREYGTAEIATRFAEHLLQNYGTDPEITFFVDYNNIAVMPMDNPDGRKMAEAGDSWRKNTDNDDGCSSADWWGTDLNRNYPFQWGCCGGSSGDPCDETYRGPSAGSEPETQAIIISVLNTFPDQRGPNPTDPAPDDATGLFITLHSAAGLLLWPWGYTGTDAPNGAQLQMIGQKLASYNGYNPQQSNDLYPTDGTTDDWTYGMLGVASFTYELSGVFFEPCSSFESTVYPDNLDSLLYAMKIPDTPYMTAFGPDALNAVATPSFVVTGDPLRLTATINDRANGNQAVQGAEYYIHPLHSATPPGEPGTGLPMQATDGSFNETEEAVYADVDTSSIGAGTYLIAIRGRDAGNHWGPFTAAYLYVAEPGVSPTIQGVVRETATLEPLPATITAGTFQATTDPATGFYSMTVMSGTYDIIATSPDHATAIVNGVVAENYQTVQQDFDLSPVCDVYADDVESGNHGWTPQSPWSITIEDAHSPTHSWTESSHANYSNSRNVSLTSQSLDLSDMSGVTVGFWHTYDIQPNADYGYVEYSINNGTTWTTAAAFSGYDHTAWTREEVFIPQLDGRTNARIRFRFFSDSSIVADGWHIDDISVYGGGPICQPALAPEAEFSSNSPVTIGEPAVFDNMTTGTRPLTFFWDFGDGLGTSADENPQYTYPMTGTFTVTLWATNTLGSDSVQHTVTVREPLLPVFLPVVVKN